MPLTASGARSMLTSMKNLYAIDPSWTLVVHWRHCRWYSWCSLPFISILLNETMTKSRTTWVDDDCLVGDTLTFNPETLGSPWHYREFIDYFSRASYSKKEQEAPDAWLSYDVLTVRNSRMRDIAYNIMRDVKDAVLTYNDLKRETHTCDAP